jgi:GNAT superfamily N-acetyltransferase
MTYQIRTPSHVVEWRDYYQLRWQMLREPHGLPLGSEQDDLESSAWHIAIFEQSNPVAIGRLHCVQTAIGQIRYMAVAPSHQRQGLGSQILAHLETLALQQGIDTIVLNARESAVPFYLQADYQVQGEGPLMFGHIIHKVMQKQLTGVNG